MKASGPEDETVPLPQQAIPLSHPFSITIVFLSRLSRRVSIRRRYLTNRFGAGAADFESALANASRIHELTGDRSAL
jgi:hypothetical protein